MWSQLTFRFAFLTAMVSITPAFIIRPPIHFGFPRIPMPMGYHPFLRLPFPRFPIPPINPLFSQVGGPVAASRGYSGGKIGVEHTPDGITITNKNPNAVVDIVTDIGHASSSGNYNGNHGTYYVTGKYVKDVYDVHNQNIVIGFILSTKDGLIAVTKEGNAILGRIVKNSSGEDQVLDEAGEVIGIC